MEQYKSISTDQHDLPYIYTDFQNNQSQLQFWQLQAAATGSATTPSSPTLKCRRLAEAVDPRALPAGATGSQSYVHSLHSYVLPHISGAPSCSHPQCDNMLHIQGGRTADRSCSNRIMLEADWLQIHPALAVKFLYRSSLRLMKSRIVATTWMWSKQALTILYVSLLVGSVYACNIYSHMLYYS